MSFPDDTWRSDREAAALEGGETCRGVGVGLPGWSRAHAEKEKKAAAANQTQLPTSGDGRAFGKRGKDTKQDRQSHDSKIYDKGDQKWN